MLSLSLSFRAKIERENRDIRLEQIKVEAAERRQTVLESIKYVIACFNVRKSKSMTHYNLKSMCCTMSIRTVGSILGTGINTFISDWDRITSAVSISSAAHFVTV